MAFCLKILGGGGDLQIIILLKNESSCSSIDMWGGRDTQPLQDGKKKLNFVHLEVVVTQKLALALELELVLVLDLELVPEVVGTWKLFGYL